MPGATVFQDSAEHPACEHILTILVAGQPMRARVPTKAVDLPTAATYVNNVRHKLRRLISRNIATEIEQGLFAAVRT